MPKPNKNMESSKIRSFLIGLLILASIFSYIYVNTATIQFGQNEPTEQTNFFDNTELEKPETNMILPEVEIVKKVLENSVKLLPAS